MKQRNKETRDTWGTQSRATNQKRNYKMTKNWDRTLRRQEHNIKVQM